MAYVPNIRVTQTNPYSFKFEDLNFLAAAPSAITSMTLRVVSSNTTTFDENINLVTAGFATDSQTAVVTNVMLGLDAEVAIPDDKYTLTYTYNFTGTPSGNSNITEKHALVGNIENYLYNKFVEINEHFFENNPLRDQYVNELVAAYALLRGLKIAATKGYVTEYTNIMLSLQGLVIFSEYSF